ncbi:adenylate/guanylate cyclase with Chase sensor [Treponema brennaborense DSM 12168]|uniref:Adenylate/guanylate cyclase with Chase sensor n=2 Tax=Treponema TaxID=157 RepID=F4LM76_TREBD|nr:adenylate/guanylate cyclase with Chase sensor [Treponema brennaborense DSM 12168]
MQNGGACVILTDMKQKTLRSALKKQTVLFAAVGIIVLVAGAYALGLLSDAENGFYDILLQVKKEPPVARELLFVDIDDLSLNEMGTWPWPRDIVADALIRMKELGAETAVFDIEYLSVSRSGVDPQAAQELPELIRESAGTVSALVTDLSDSLADGRLTSADAPAVAQDMVSGYIEPLFGQLYDTAANQLYRDNDDYFARALRFFGNSYLTVNYANVMETAAEAKEAAQRRFLFDSVRDGGNRTERDNLYTVRKQDIEPGFSPPLKLLTESARGAGFTNVVVDSDGSRRRMELLYRYGDGYLAQLVFSPLLDRLDSRELERTARSLIIRNALIAPDVRRDVTIPLDAHGRMLINWLRGDYFESFRHEPIVYLNQLDSAETNIVGCIEWLCESLYILDENGGWLPYYGAAQQLSRSYGELLQRKRALLAACGVSGAGESGVPEDIAAETYAQYFADRRAFFDAAASFAGGAYLQEIETRLDRMVLNGEAGAAQAEPVREAARDTFGLLAQNVNAYRDMFSQMEEIYAGSFCIIGNSATGTTDMGATPFVSRYPNVGTHGNVYNTIVTQSFIYPVRGIVPLAVAALLLVLYIVLLGKKQALFQNAAGVVMIALVPAASFICMRLFNVYVPAAAALVVTAVGYVVVAVYRYATTENDKRFLRQAFSTYLSQDVVDDIVNDPAKLALGGVEKNITAFFTDIKSFSSLSEQVTPVQLVSILNEYLTTMSDVILERKGTIDKYIGDAIVAFFGAPADLADHAYRACASALRIKELEREFNERHLADESIPMPIRTRIGINTGKMVVGNMGTSSKMNYTIMGNNVNIAARLEGVNKVYGSWILVAEDTWKDVQAGSHKDEITVRRLDKVRVVGINTPVQLYTLAGFTADLPARAVEAIDVFHEGLDRYLEKDFKAALTLFEKAAAIDPEDTTAPVFAERCRGYCASMPPAGWTGVVNLTSK